MPRVRAADSTRARSRSRPRAAVADFGFCIAHGSGRRGVRARLRRAGATTAAIPGSARRAWHAAERDEILGARWTPRAFTGSTIPCSTTRGDRARRFPELLGKPSPAAEPWAELWMGAHPVATSRVEGPDGVRAARRVHRARSRGGARRGGGRALRGQAAVPVQGARRGRAALDPGASEPRAGARGVRARESRGHGARRAESLLSRRQSQARADLRAHAVSRAESLPRARRDRGSLRRARASRSSRQPIAALRERAATARGSRHSSRRSGRSASPRARAAIASARRDGRASAGAAIRRRAGSSALARRHPGDIGVLAPLLLNVVELAPGEAMFLPAGELHSYLEGVGIEIMANSDNVLRGGLTAKHVDVPELLRTLAFRAGAVERLRPRRGRERGGPLRDAGRGVRARRPRGASGRALARARASGASRSCCARRAAGGSSAPETHSVARGDCFVDARRGAGLHRRRGAHALPRRPPASRDWLRHHETRRYPSNFPDSAEMVGGVVVAPGVSGAAAAVGSGIGASARARAAAQGIAPRSSPSSCSTWRSRSPRGTALNLGYVGLCGS